ncbi:hypothetical protein SAY86_031265 [Trapa natans]|uniref:Cyclin N-terminal domain-containing protein n=1 Tax=Trapa natans TaxID=22666 RepID=A0AAN7M2U9_TRANT|nr:hypothetical protein SAY86_031265 [Trapa natans]
MSISYSDSLPDLLCEEDSVGVLSGVPLSMDCSSGLEHPAIIEDLIDELIEDEKEFVPDFNCIARSSSQSVDASARLDSVAWILKVHAYYGFQPLTAYLAVNYFHRFLYSGRLPQTSGWPMQLLSVACLSLAAKMEEPLVPSLLDIQVEGAKFVFEPRTITRMELLVLTVLNWRLRSVTPFSFIGFFACKIDPSGSCIGYLISRSTDIILSEIQEASFLEYLPSCIAAAAVLCAASEIPSLMSFVNPENAESWCDGLIKEKIAGCYQLMQSLVLIKNNRRKPPKVLPQFRVMPRARVSRFSDDNASSSSSSISSPYNKRRKLNNSLWVDIEKGSSEQ